MTFSGDTLPEKMYVGPFRVNVRQYIPNPRRCFRCQKLGHSKTFCTGEQVCENCGQPGHLRGDCSGSPYCVNCKGDHPSTSRDCPLWKKEKAIIERQNRELNLLVHNLIKNVILMLRSQNHRHQTWAYKQNILGHNFINILFFSHVVLI